MSKFLILAWYKQGKHVVMLQREMTFMVTDLNWVMTQISEVNNNAYVEAYVDNKRVGTYGTKPEE